MSFPNKFPRRGEVYWAPAATKVRPVVVVSAEHGNQHSASVVVAAISSKIAKKVFPVNVFLPANDPLPKAGEVRCRSLYELLKVDLEDYRCTLSSAQMKEVDAAIRVALGL